MTQITLWLLPLVVGSFFGISTSLRAGWRWSWGMIVQHMIVLIIAVCGLWVFPKWDWLCAYLGWGFLLGFTVVARVMLMKMTQALGLLRSQQAISQARMLRFILWGPPGKYWLDLAYMINFSVRGDTRSANDIYKKWEVEKLPRQVTDSLTAYAMIGYLMLRDWQSTVEKFETTKKRYELERNSKKAARFPFQIAVPAIRAYNELGLYSQAREALLLADLAGAGVGRDSLDTIFLSYFALLGSDYGINEVLQSMSQSKGALPEYARLFWQARCASQRHDYESAIRVFGESLRKTPEKDSAWRERTQYQISLNQEKMLEEKQEADPLKERERIEAIKSGLQIMHRCYAIADILSNRKSPLAARALTGVITVAYLLYCSVVFFQDRVSYDIRRFLDNYGPLTNAAVHGEPWRLLSYMFLHGGLSHLFMNLFGLIWFGRFVENVFGSSRFLIIFFGSGILSGLAQTLLEPNEAAIGASGAVLGVFGAGLAAMLRLKNVLPAHIRNSELSWMIALAVTQLLFDQIVNFLFPSVQAAKDAVKIASTAHFAGMLSGFAIGWILSLKQQCKEESVDVNS